MRSRKSDADQVRSPEAVAKLAEEPKATTEAKTTIEKTEVEAKELNNEPKTLAQLRQEGKESILVTEAAWEYLTHPDPSNKELCFNFKVRKNSFTEELWNVVITRRFQGFQPQRQLTLAEAKGAVQFLQEKWKKTNQEEQRRHMIEKKKAEISRDMRDQRPNAGIPKGTLDNEGKVICARHRKIGYRFQAMEWSLVLFKFDGAGEVTGEIPTDPETGKPAKRGNFWLLNKGNGNLEVVALCQDCGLEYKSQVPVGAPDYLRHGHPYEIALKLAETKSHEIQKGIRRQEEFSQYAQNAAELAEGDYRRDKRDFRGGRR